MTASAEMAPNQWLARALGHDSPRSFLRVVALFGVYLVAERTAGQLVQLELGDLSRSSLVLRSLWNAAPVTALVVIAVVAALVRPSTRSRLTAPWSRLEHGRALRWLCAPFVVLLAWQGALYEFNWFAGRVHVVDRLLVLALAVAALWRPAFLLAFAIVFRIVDQQFVLPFGTAAGGNIDRLLVLALVAVAAAHLLFVITGSTATASVLLLVTAALAAHFFVPGKGKLGMGWLTSGDPSNLPLSGYTTGWMGHTDGGWARSLAARSRDAEWPLKLGTLGVELGALVAVVHPKLTRIWLPAVVAFHVAVFLTTGFWFATWVVLEVGLFVILGHRGLREWVAQNATPARGLLTAVAVLGAPVLFRPPGLAWLDAPVSYGYEIEAVGESGTAYHVALSAFAPLDQHLAFDRVRFTSAVPATAAYGALTSTAEFEALEAVTDFDALAAYERGLGTEPVSPASAEFVQTFLERTADRPSLDWSALAPPGHFWTSRAEPDYDFQEPLVELSVYRVRSIHQGGTPEYRRELVLETTREADPAG